MKCVRVMLALVGIAGGCSRGNLPNNRIDLGEVTTTIQYPTEFKITNVYDVAMRLKTFKTSCKCSAPSFEETLFEPGQTKSIAVTLDTNLMGKSYPDGGQVSLTPVFTDCVANESCDGNPIELSFKVRKSIVANVPAVFLGIGHEETEFRVHSTSSKSSLRLARYDSGMDVRMRAAADGTNDYIISARLLATLSRAYQAIQIEAIENGLKTADISVPVRVAESTPVFLSRTHEIVGSEQRVSIPIVIAEGFRVADLSVTGRDGIEVESFEFDERSGRIDVNLRRVSTQATLSNLEISVQLEKGEQMSLAYGLILVSNDRNNHEQGFSSSALKGS